VKSEAITKDASGEVDVIVKFLGKTLWGVLKTWMLLVVLSSFLSVVYWEWV
jgi:hypothetical protein